MFTAILPFFFEADVYFLDVPPATLIASAFLPIKKATFSCRTLLRKPTDTPLTTIARTLETNLKTVTHTILFLNKL